MGNIRGGSDEDGERAGLRHERTSVHAQAVMKTLLSFAAGGLLGEVFLHSVPHLMQVGREGDSWTKAP